MPSWNINDASNSKPKWDVERQTREVYVLTTANTTNSGVTSIVFSYNDGAQNNVANVGIVVGAYAYATNLSSGGTAGFFKSNNTVASISGNVVTFTKNTFGSIPATTTVEFDKSIAYNSNKTVEYTYNQDTILVTNTRLANGNTSVFASNVVSGVNPGWVHFQQKVNNDGTVRLLHETLVALANGQAANTNSANTSFSQLFTGL